MKPDVNSCKMLNHLKYEQYELYRGFTKNKMFISE